MRSSRPPGLAEIRFVTLPIGGAEPMREKRLSRKKLDRLVRRLHSPDEVVRVHAAQRLTASDVDEDAVRPALVAALTDPDPQVRKLAGWVLERLGPSSHAA